MVANHPVLQVLLGSWQVLMRCIASALFLLAHGLLVLEHIAIGTALHGIAELFLAPWALRHKAWDIIVIGLIFCVFDLWGTLRLTGALVFKILGARDTLVPDLELRSRPMDFCACNLLGFSTFLV